MYCLLSTHIKKKSGGVAALTFHTPSSKYFPRELAFPKRFPTFGEPPRSSSSTSLCVAPPPHLPPLGQIYLTLLFSVSCMYVVGLAKSIYPKILTDLSRHFFGERRAPKRKRSVGGGDDHGNQYWTNELPFTFCCYCCCCCRYLRLLLPAEAHPDVAPD